MNMTELRGCDSHYFFVKYLKNKTERSTYVGSSHFWHFESASVMSISHRHTDKTKLSLSSLVCVNYIGDK